MRAIQIRDAEHWFNMPADLSMQMRDIVFYKLFGNLDNHVFSDLKINCYKNGSVALVGKINEVYFKVHFQWIKALHGNWRHVVTSITCKNPYYNYWLFEIFQERYYSRIWNGGV